MHVLSDKVLLNPSVSQESGQVVAEHGDTIQAISNVWLGGMKHFEGAQRYVFTHQLRAELANRHLERLRAQVHTDIFRHFLLRGFR